MTGRRQHLPDMIPRADRLLAALAAILSIAAATGNASREAPAGPSRVDLIRAEAARAGGSGQLDTLRAGLQSRAPDLQRIAVRALGRLERADLLPDILPLLTAPSAAVRAEAANAVAQAVTGGTAGGIATARARLVERLQQETDEEVRGDLCAALGRLPFDSANDVDRVQKLLADETRRSTAGPDRLAAIGALRGLESLVRVKAKLARASEDTRAALEALLENDHPVVRRLSLLVLNLAGGPSAPALARGAEDEDEQVRRLAMAAGTASQELIQKGLADPSAMVRLEALRVWGRRFQAAAGCAPLVARTKDVAVGVSLLALDLLGGTCRPEDAASSVLVPLAGETTGAAWHRSAHALVALARINPDEARLRLGSHLRSEPWQRRMYVAQAAAILRDEAVLRALAADRSTNVQEAALSGLSRLVGHAADALFLQALSSDDPQVVMTAARALEGTPDREAATAALFSSLRRLTAADSDNTRDPRVAILDRIGEVGVATRAAELEPLLVDPDAKVAARASAILTRWTGTSRPAVSTPRPAAAVPDQATLDRLARTTVRVTMSTGGTFEVTLLADLAPLSCARFLELAAGGYYTGLTFHRIVPNFVIQGGSPGANEFWGDRRFMRDEVGRVMQSRGTLGISTRGRDTGDAQFYVNLVDLPRLDHEYTVFARVTSGMEVVDAVLEGDRIVAMQVSQTRSKGSR